MEWLKMQLLHRNRVWIIKTKKWKLQYEKKSPIKGLRLGKAEAVNTNTDEGLLTTNQQFVIMLLQTSLGGAWEGC